MNSPKRPLLAPPGKRWSLLECMLSLSGVLDSATLWTVAHQVPQSMGFFRQEYWNGLPFPSPGDLPHPGLEPESPVSCFASVFFTCWAIQESLSLTRNLGYISNWLWQIKWSRSEIAQEPSQVFKRLPVPSWSLRQLSEEARNRLPGDKRHTAHHSCH